MNFLFAAFFLLPLFIVGLAGAVYGSEYMKGGKERLRPGRWRRDGPILSPPVSGPLFCLPFFSPLERFPAAWSFSRWRQGREPLAASATWGCGFAFPASRMSYSAESYTELPQSAMFCSCVAPAIGDGRPIGFFPAAESCSFAVPDPVLGGLFKPFFYWAARVCSGFRGLQAGQLHVYLLYIFSVTILLLFWVGPL